MENVKKMCPEILPSAWKMTKTFEWQDGNAHPGLMSCTTLTAFNIDNGGKSYVPLWNRTNNIIKKSSLFAVCRTWRQLTGRGERYSWGWSAFSIDTASLKVGSVFKWLNSYPWPRLPRWAEVCQELPGCRWRSRQCVIECAGKAPVVTRHGKAPPKGTWITYSVDLTDG